jgi:hypothetical protein
MAVAGTGYRHSQEVRIMTETVTTPAPVLATPDQIGTPAQCPVMSKGDKGSRCKYAVHAGDKHKYAVRKPGTDRPALPAGFRMEAATEVKSGDALAKQTSGGARGDTAPRDANQRLIDKDAEKNHKANIGAGSTRTTEFKSLKLSRYTVTPETLDAVIAMLKRSVNSGGPAKGGALRYRQAPQIVDGKKTGRTELQWAIVRAIK